jgi:hypothetical protein
MSGETAGGADLVLAHYRRCEQCQRSGFYPDFWNRAFGRRADGWMPGPVALGWCDAGVDLWRAEQAERRARYIAGHRWAWLLDMILRLLRLEWRALRAIVTGIRPLDR